MLLGFCHLTMVLCILTIMSTSCLRSVNDSSVFKINPKLLSTAYWKDISWSGSYPTLLACSLLATLAYSQFSNMPCSLLPLSSAHGAHHVTKVGISPSLESLTCLFGQREISKHLCSRGWKALKCWSLTCPVALGNPEIAILRSSDSSTGGWDTTWSRHKVPQLKLPSLSGQSALQHLDMWVRSSYTNQCQPSWPD